MNSKTISLYDDQMEYLDQKKTQGISASFILREAIEMYRKMEERKRLHEKKKSVCRHCRKRGEYYENEY